MKERAALDEISNDQRADASTLIAIFQSAHTCATWSKDFYNKQIFEFAVPNQREASRAKSVDYIGNRIAMTDDQYGLPCVVRQDIILYLQCFIHLNDRQPEMGS